MKTPEELNFRKVPELHTCSNCDEAKCDIKLGEGYDRCKVTGQVLYWPKKRSQVCDAWKAKHVPTAREEAIARLSAKDRRALGL